MRESGGEVRESGGEGVGVRGSKGSWGGDSPQVTVRGVRSLLERRVRGVRRLTKFVERGV